MNPPCCDSCTEHHKMLFLFIFLVLMLSIAVSAVSGRYLEHKIDTRSPETWTYRVEDDAPRCWKEYNPTQPDNTEVICGPLSLAPVGATLIGR